jgi:hypothetical protein
MAKLIRELLETVEWRLEETIAAFTVTRAINERCMNDVSLNLKERINSRSGFWKPVTVGLQTTVFLGICAILDKNSDDSATLYLILKKLKNTRPELPTIPANLEIDLDVIRTRYSRFRHKLFGHNDINREVIANIFDEAGFTWDSIASDLAELEYIFKVLWHLESGNNIPDRPSAEKMIYPYRMFVAKSQIDTLEFLDEICNANQATLLPRIKKQYDPLY